MKYNDFKEKFGKFEQALTVAYKIDPNFDVNKGYLFFSRTHLINKKNFSKEDYILQNACSILRRFRAGTIWKEILEEYKNDIYQNIRAFNIKKDDEGKEKLEERDLSNTSDSDRISRYIQEVEEYIPKLKKVECANNGIFEYKIGNEIKEVRIGKNDSKESKTFSEGHSLNKTIQKNPIKISYKELKEATEEIKKYIPEDYCSKIIEENVIKKFTNNKARKANKIEIDKITNIVGMVGAGKTTLLKVLGYILAKQNKKIVIVLDTVVEVFKLYEYFHKLECNCSVFVGKSEREKYINQLMEDEDSYLPPHISKLLTSICILEGQDETDESILFGKEPCTELFDEKSKKYCICPYYNECPTTEMQRGIFTSNILVTTVPGLILGRVGKAQRYLLEEVIDKADVVFFDECDRVQKKADQIFIPSVSFDKFVRGTKDYINVIFNYPNSERMKNEDVSKYTDLIFLAQGILKVVVLCIENILDNEKFSLVENTFTSWLVLESLRKKKKNDEKKNVEKDFISEDLYKDLKELIMDRNIYPKSEKTKIEELRENYCYREENLPILENELKKYLQERNEIPKILTKREIENEIQRLKNTNINKDELHKKLEEEAAKGYRILRKIKLVIVLSYFDNYMRKIEYLYEQVKDEIKGTHTNEIHQFFRKNFFTLQNYFPSSLIGNLFGIQYNKDEKDVFIYRQYAYGRALLTELPYMKIDINGNPLGPHSVLLSGSSFAPSSLMYHVNADVNYVVEASPKVVSFLKKAIFHEIYSNTRVSGSDKKKKNEILVRLTEECINDIKRELDSKDENEKILVVVNSYEQAGVVAETLRSALKKIGDETVVFELVSDYKDDNFDKKNRIKRGDIYKLSESSARILVAPALAIERGHNIVDSDGHSAFTSIFFMVRPLSVPDEFSDIITKTNGYIAGLNLKKYDENIYKKVEKIRAESVTFYKQLIGSSKYSLNIIKNQMIKTDIVATTFVLILQIFGRLCRITNLDKNPPTVYFADGAFRKKIGNETGFDMLDEFHKYLKDLLENEKDKNIAEVLYRPFYEAFKRGIRNGTKI